MSSTKLSIYPEPEPAVTVVRTQTELEKQIGSARQSLQAVTRGTKQSVGATVESWIKVEKKVETEVKSVIPADEPLTPGLLYVGVATLAGSVFTRFRSFPIRAITPPAFLLVSLSFFNPKLSSNLSSYYTNLESAHFPKLTKQRQSLVATVRDRYHSLISQVDRYKKEAEGTVQSGLKEVESTTGLRISQVVKEK